MTEYTFENLMHDLLNDEDKCRICLKKGSLKSIQSDYCYSFKIYDMLQKINCVLDANTTTKICTKCLERLKTAYEFTLNFDEATQYYDNLNPYFNFNNEKNCKYEQTTLEKNKPKSSNEYNFFFEPITLENNNVYSSNEQNIVNESTTVDKNKSYLSKDCNSVYESITPEHTYLDFSKQYSANESTTVDKNEPYLSNKNNSYDLSTPDNTRSFAFEQNSAYKYTTLDDSNLYFQYEQNAAYEQTAFDQNNPYFNVVSVLDEKTCDNTTSDITFEQNSKYESKPLDKNSTYEQSAIDKSNLTLDENKLCFNMEQNYFYDVTTVDKTNTSFNEEQNPVYDGSTVNKNYFRDCVVSLEKVYPIYENSKNNKTKITTSSKKIEKISRSKQIAKIKKECPRLEENPKKDKNKPKTKISAKKEKRSKVTQLKKECPPLEENQKKDNNLDNNNTKRKIPIKTEKKLNSLQLLEKILIENNPFLTGVEYINTPISKNPRNKRIVKNKRGRPPSAENLMKNRILVVSSSAIQEVFQKQISPVTLANKNKKFSITTTVVLCNTCDKLFLTQSVLEAHECFGKGTVNLSLKKTEIKCNRCQRKFKNVVLLSNHVCFFLKCLKCKILFKSNKDIEEHENENCC